MKAVIYARYSSDNQREEPIEGQLRECAAFAEKNGITILRNYIDRAYSAKTDTFSYENGTKTITFGDVEGSDFDFDGVPNS